MDKNSTLFSDLQETPFISFSKSISGKKIKVDFDAPDLSSHGGLLFASVDNCAFIDRMSDCMSCKRFRKAFERVEFFCLINMRHCLEIANFLRKEVENPTVTFIRIDAGRLYDSTLLD